MRAFSTLWARITLAAAAAILAAIVVFAVVTVAIVRHELHSSLDASLRQRAVTVAELAVSAPAVLERPGALEGTASGRQISVEVLARNGGLVARSPSLGALLLPRDDAVRAALSRGRARYANVTVGGRVMRMYAAPVADAGGPASGGAVLAASDTSDIAQTTGHLGAAVAVAGAIIAAAAALIAGLLTRRTLRPLGRLASAAGEIERTADVSRRLPESGGKPNPRDEAARLTGVLNRMLASLEQARAGERRFLADASHELRTPITGLLGNVQYASRHGADAEVLADLRLDAERLARLVDSLLVLERAGAGGGRGGGWGPGSRREVSLADVAEEAVAGLDGAAERVRLRVDDDATVSGDPEALRRAVANLVENGLVHGPPDGPVTVVVGTEGATARVAVSDAGPGPDPQAGDRPFQRFWRGDGASQRPGSGLGLSIVAAIAAAHEGSVTVEGATFVIALPAVRD
jgi:signal transduction histidine kinase